MRVSARAACAIHTPTITRRKKKTRPGEEAGSKRRGGRVGKGGRGGREREGRVETKGLERKAILVEATEKERQNGDGGNQYNKTKDTTRRQQHRQRERER